MNTKALLDLYEKTYFDEFVRPEDIVSPGGKKKAAAEYERDPARALLENVDDSKRAVEYTLGRLRRAQQDGLFELDGFKAATKQEKKRWTLCLDTIRGDYNRAKSELAHWREYVKWATEEQRAKVARIEARLPDPRLPPEQDDEVAF